MNKAPTIDSLCTGSSSLVCFVSAFTISIVIRVAEFSFFRWPHSRLFLPFDDTSPLPSKTEFSVKEEAKLGVTWQKTQSSTTQVLRTTHKHIIISLFSVPLT